MNNLFLVHDQASGTYETITDTIISVMTAEV